MNIATRPKKLALSRSITLFTLSICMASLSSLIGCDKDESPSPPPSLSQGGVENEELNGGEGESGAGESGAGASGEEASNDCRPDSDPDQLAQGLQFLSEHCGLCHGTSPAYGAPYSLTNPLTLFDGDVGGRPIDRSVARLLEGTMPPTGHPQPPATEAQTWIDWATCGQGEARVPPGGFEVNRPLYPSASPPPSDAEVLEVTAPSFIISPDRSDEYKCFGFPAPGGANAERLIIRIEPIIDDARVIHHMVLYETEQRVERGGEVDCGAGLGAAVYAWAPGQTPLHFNEGGLVSGNDRQYLLEIHYNNSGGYDDVQDESGVRLYHSAPSGPRIDMMTLGPDAFNLPARARTSIAGDCVIEEPIEIVAMLPHMHEIGQSLTSLISRDGAEQESNWETLIELTGWDFNFQLIYDGEGETLNPGDVVRTTCIYENEGEVPRSYGPFTDDEMCYNFLYVTPPPQERRCNQPIDDSDEYLPGACAPAGAEAVVESILGRYNEGQSPTPEGGRIPRGLFRLETLDLWFESFDLGIATVDPTMSFYEGVGALSIDEVGAFNLDMQGEANLTSEQGAQFMRAVQLTFGGQMSSSAGIGLDPPEGETAITVSLDCPQEQDVEMNYTATEDRMTIFLSFNDPVPGIQVMTFIKAQ